jgi:hypothetical protein
MKLLRGTAESGSDAGKKEPGPHYGKPIFLAPGHGGILSILHPFNIFTCPGGEGKD